MQYKKRRAKEKEDERRTARLPPNLARQFVNRHLCTALTDPVLWHRDSLAPIRREGGHCPGGTGDGSAMVDAVAVTMNAWRPLTNAPSHSMASGRTLRLSCWQAGSNFFFFFFVRLQTNEANPTQPPHCEKCCGQKRSANF